MSDVRDRLTEYVRDHPDVVVLALALVVLALAVIVWLWAVQVHKLGREIATLRLAALHDAGPRPVHSGSAGSAIYAAAAAAAASSAASASPTAFAAAADRSGNREVERDGRQVYSVARPADADGASAAAANAPVLAQDSLGWVVARDDVEAPADPHAAAGAALPVADRLSWVVARDDVEAPADMAPSAPEPLEAEPYPDPDAPAAVAVPVADRPNGHDHSGRGDLDARLQRLGGVRDGEPNGAATTAKQPSSQPEGHVVAESAAETAGLESASETAGLESAPFGWAGTATPWFAAEPPSAEPWPHLEARHPSNHSSTADADQATMAWAELAEVTAGASEPEELVAPAEEPVPDTVASLTAAPADVPLVPDHLESAVVAYLQSAATDESFDVAAHVDRPATPADETEPLPPRAVLPFDPFVASGPPAEPWTFTAPVGPTADAPDGERDHAYAAWDAVTARPAEAEPSGTPADGTAYLAWDEAVTDVHGPAPDPVLERPADELQDPEAGDGEVSAPVEADHDPSGTGTEPVATPASPGFAPWPTPQRHVSPAPPAEGVAADARPPVTMPPGAGPGSTTDILLVEDDENVATVYRLLLESKGYTVRHALDGIAGLELVTARRPDLILLDVMMPQMNGIVFLQSVRARADLNDVPVVILSNFREPRLVERALALGAIEYMVKAQTRPDALLGAIPRWVSGQRAFSG